MKLIEIGLNHMVRLPECWDYFSWRGIVYRKDQWGRWVIDRRMEAKKTA